MLVETCSLRKIKTQSGPNANSNNIKNVTDDEDLMVINKSGITIRIGVDTLRVMGRATQGVKIIRLREDDSIASVAKVTKAEEDASSDKSDKSENDDINIESENE